VWTKRFSSDFQFISVSSYDIIVKLVFYQCLVGIVAMILLSLFLSLSYDGIGKFVFIVSYDVIVNFVFIVSCDAIVKFVTMSILVRNKNFVS
jgi:hypothetical protein